MQRGIRGRELGRSKREIDTELAGREGEREREEEENVFYEPC